VKTHVNLSLNPSMLNPLVVSLGMFLSADDAGIRGVSDAPYWSSSGREG
jgi:hypothetical protein